MLLPNKESSGISRKIEDEEDRKRLKELVEQIKTEDGIGFIVRTAGMNRTKQELARDYQHLSRLWKEIQKRAAETAAPALIYQESDFGVRSLRDYFTSDIEEILVDDVETFRQMRAYCKAVAPRNVKMIKLDKEKTPIFDKYQLEDQIRVIYQDRVELKSGGYLIINPTEAMITIDVNSGRGSNKRNVEETAFKTNMEAAEEIARQLRLRDLGGLIVIDFIDMMDIEAQRGGGEGLQEGHQRWTGRGSSSPTSPNSASWSSRARRSSRRSRRSATRPAPSAGAAGSGRPWNTRP